MFQKYSLLIFLFFLLINSTISIVTISKYGTLTTTEKEAFLETSDFKVDEEIYITITSKTGYCSNGLRYKFYSTNTISNPTAYKSVSSYTTSSVTVGSYTEVTYHYTVKKENSNDNYLYMLYDCTGKVKIENTEEDEGKTIMIVAIVCSVVFVIIIIVIIVCCCRRCKRTGAVYGGVAYPTPVPIGAVGYGVSPYGVPPVVGVQPIQPVVNVQPYVQPVSGASYSNIQNPQGYSSNRNEPIQNYEKPRI